MSVICSNSIVEKLPKLSYSEHHDKIIKAIHYKITPLNMSPKAVIFFKYKRKELYKGRNLQNDLLLTNTLTLKIKVLIH